jgi:hypothetical protein
MPYLGRTLPLANSCHRIVVHWMKVNLETRPNRNFQQRFKCSDIPNRSEELDPGELRQTKSWRKEEGKRVSGGNKGAHVCWAALQKS